MTTALPRNVKTPLVVASIIAVAALVAALADMHAVTVGIIALAALVWLVVAWLHLRRYEHEQTAERERVEQAQINSALAGPQFGEYGKPYTRPMTPETTPSGSKPAPGGSSRLPVPPERTRLRDDDMTTSAPYAALHPAFYPDATDRDVTPAPSSPSYDPPSHTPSPSYDPSPSPSYDPGPSPSFDSGSSSSF